MTRPRIRILARVIRTKIIATLGPAVGSPDRLLRLFQAGCDVCRLNFSHGTLDDHLKMLRMIREAAMQHDAPVAVLGDLCGPKIRLGKVADFASTGGIPIDKGDTLIIARGTFVAEHTPGNDRRASSIYANLVDDVQVGHRVLIEDGLLRFICVDKTYNELKLQCLAGGVLKSSKGINLPDTHVTIPAITDQDWQCVEWAIENDLDYLALSFVRSPDDIKLLQQSLVNRQSDIHIIAKIEKPEAITAIDEIISASHGLMVARGDLGVEIDLAHVPIIQKDLIRKCRLAAKPVIVATQMLQSMVDNSSPTRAEVSDVANAIFDGTDAVMLSGETSVGKYATEAVHTMAHIAEVAEEFQDSAPDFRPPGGPDSRVMQISNAVANAVAQIVKSMPIELVVLYSQTGATARVFSKHRFPVPILALSSDHKSLRQMALHFGVMPTELPPPQDMDDLVHQVDRLVQERKIAQVGQRIVVVAGASLGTPGTRNAVVLHTVGSDFSNAKEQLSGMAITEVKT
ncbi:MAG: pyruvate kinase [Tepidisphaeraceae bacterium]